MNGSARNTLVSVLLLGALLAATAVGFAHSFVAGFPLSGADETEHMLMARVLAERGALSVTPPDPYAYVALNLIEGRDGAYHPKHPYGYPLLLAAAYRVGGPDAPFLVSPLFALLGLVALFCFGRLLAGDAAALVATLALAVNPLFAAYGLATMSHSAALAFTIGGLYFVWRWSLRGGADAAALGGLLCGYAATVRYAELLLLAPIAVAIGWRVVEMERAPAPTARTSRRTLVRDIAILGLCLVAVYLPLLASQWKAYGNPFVTGQGITESSGIALHYWPHNTAVLLRQLWDSQLWVVYGGGLGALGALWWRRPRIASFLTAWAGVHFALYHSFYWRDDQSWVADMRYYMDLLPPLLLAIVTCIAAFLPRARDRSIALALVVVALVPANALLSLRLLAIERSANLASQQISAVLQETLPPDAVVFTDEDILSALSAHDDAPIYYDAMFHPDFVRSYEPILTRDGPWPISRARILAWKSLLGGRSAEQLAEAEREIVARYLAEGRPVVFVTAGSYVQDWRERLGAAFEISTLAERPLYLDESDARFPSRLLSTYALRPRRAPSDQGDERTR